MAYLRTGAGAAINFPGPLTPQLTLPDTSVKSAAQVVAASRVSSPLAQSNPQVAQASVAVTVAGAMTMEQLQKRRNELAIKIKSFQQKGGRKLKVGAEPPRNKTHWDYVLQEMTWMAADFKRFFLHIMTGLVQFLIGLLQIAGRGSGKKGYRRKFVGP